MVSINGHFVKAFRENDMKRRFRRGRVAFFFWAALATVLPWSVAHAEQSNSRKVHELAMFFTSNSWFNCAARADQLGSFLGGNVKNQAFAVSFPTENSSMVDVFLVVPPASDESIPTSAHLTFAVNIEGCPAVYSLSNILETSCADALEGAQVTTQFTEIGDFGHFISQVDPHTTIRLASQGSFCLKTQTEIVE